MAHESDSSKQLTSLLINRQVPEFVREDHPIFISFLEAYYEFLETEQGTQNNDLVKVTKDMRRKSDVDDSIDAFENSFFNTFANLVPKDAKIDKAFLIKNVLPLYLSKGNEKSFKLLFRMIFGEESDVIFPEDQVLRASDGQYASESILTITDQISSFYTGTGNTNQSIQLVQEVSPEQIEVKVDGVKKDHVTDYFIRKEDKKIFFNDTVTVKRDLEGEIIVGTNTSFIDLDTADMSSLALRTSNLQELLISGDIIPGRTTLTFKDKAPNFNIYTADIEAVSNSTNLQLSNITTTPFGNSAQTVVSNFPADSVNVSGSNTGFFTTTSNVGTPASGSDIRVLYNDFNDALLKNRKFRGVTSNATMIVERVFPRKIDVLPKIELFFDSRKSLGSFSQSEEVKSTIVVNGDVINISTNTFSSLEEITVTQGGNNYNVGDPVTIIAGGFKRKAAAEVATLGSAILEKPNVIQGGAGFAAGGLLKGGNSEVGIVLYTIAANVNTIPIIDTTGINTPNTFVLMGETFDATISSNTSQTFAELVIGTGQVAISNSTQVLSTTNVGGYARSFTNTQVSLPDGNSVIKHVVNSSVQAANIGPISQSQVIVVTSNTPIVNLPLDGAGALVEVAARTTADVGSLKSLGKLTLRTFRSNTNVETGIVTFDNVSVGNTFSTNDIIEFSSTGAGDGALARVKEVNATGEIINTEFVHPHYKNFGTGVRDTHAFISTVSANTGFRGTAAIPNVYVSSIVVDCYGLSQNAYPNINVGLSGVYMTPQSNHNGLTLADGDNPVRIGDTISVLGYERKVINVSSSVSINAIGYNTNRYGTVTQNTGVHQSYTSNLSPVLDSQVGNTGNAGGYITRTIDPFSIVHFAGLNVRPVFHYTSGANLKSQIMLDDINVDSMVYTFGEWSSSQNTALSSFTRFDGSLQYPYFNNGGYLGGYSPTTSVSDMVNQWEQRSPRMGSNTADYGQAFSGKVGFSGADFNPTYTRLMGLKLGEFSGNERGAGRWVMMAHGPNETPSDFSTIGSTVYRDDQGQYDNLNFASGLTGTPFVTSNTNTFGADANGQIRYAGDGAFSNDNKNWLERATSNAISISEQKYIYANTFGANNSHFWLRGPVMTLSQNPTFTFASCLFGDAVGTLNVHFDVVEGNSNPFGSTKHSGGFLTVDRPFPREADFLYFSNTTFFGSHGLANSTVNISPSHTGTSLNVSTDTMNISNIFGAPLSIDTHFPKGGAAYNPSYLPNVSIFRTNRTNAAALRTISEIDVNSSAVGVNSFISLFTESQTYADQSEMKLVANARIFVSSTNQIENVTVIRGGALTGDTISVANIYTDVVFAENNAPLTSKAYSNAVFTIKTVSADNFALSGNILSTAANANIAVNCLLGDGEEIISETDESLEGSIKTIRVTDAGLGYQAIPDIDLTDSGDGKATAVAGLTDSVSTTDGRFISSRGLISAKERKVQGENYYQEFVYVTKVPVEFEKYKTILKGLLHPAGYRNRAEFEAKEISNANVFVSTTSVSNSIPGTVNISNGSTVVTGLNTSFEIANSQNTIVLGVSKIAIGNVKASVHSNSRLIVSITNNTSLVVNTAFEKTLTGQSAIILV